MKMKKFHSQSILLAAFLSAGTVQAAIVADYQFDSASDPVFLSSSDADAGSVASDITAGAGATLDRGTENLAGANGTSVMEVFSNSGTDQVNSLTDAVDHDVYFSFTLTPEAGTTLSFTNFDGLVRRSASSSTRGWLLRSSLTGVTDLAEDSSISAFRAGAMESMTASAGSLDLSGVAALQNIAGPVTFTIYTNPGTGSSLPSGRFVDYDNITVSATVVVPEPSSAAALLGLAGLSIAFVRRRR